MIRFDDILEKVSDSMSEKDIYLLKKAYVFAAKSHKGQVRRSGEPYLSHPLEVANMLADMQLDKTTLAAGLLHDVLEDSEVTIKDLQEAFGKEIADLVEGVTKINRVHDVSPELDQAETIRKIILAMTDDLRVIFIKLADRIHNLKTLKFLPEDKQKQIAKETLDIYAPIANRLGMGRIKAELEDLSFRYVAPEDYFRIASLVEPVREKAERELKFFQGQLEALMRENNIPCEIFYRIKRFYSIYNKIKRQNIEFDQVYDFLALRLITDSVKNCYAALGIIHQKWPPILHRFRDFIAMPKPNLYQGLHTTIITENKLTFEIQIRTQEMHYLAENGIAAHWKYKEADPQSLMKEDRRLQWLREMVDLYREQRNPREFLKGLKTNLIPEEVYVFTPKGKVISLPMGATALDFAFKIHTEIGFHAAGARINGKLVGLKTPLKPGDIVEILTSPEKTPHHSWLSIVFTSSARQHIKRWLNWQKKVKSAALGKKLWEKEIRRYSLPQEFLKEEELIPRLASALPFRLKSLEDFYILVGLGKVVVNKKLLERIFPSLEAQSRKEPFLRRVARKVQRALSSENQAIESVEAPLHLAKCCSPIKGEPILGYITKGKGITIHSQRCPFVTKELLDSQRIVEVSWEAFPQENYKCRLLILAEDRPGLLAQVASIIAQQGGDITKAEVDTFAGKKAQIKLSLLVHDIKHLESIILKLFRVKEISSVERV